MKKKTFLEWLLQKLQPPKKRKTRAPQNKVRGSAPENKMNG